MADQANKESPPDELDVIQHRNPVDALGWAMMSHAATLDKDLSDGAYRLLGLLIMHAQQKGICWPLRETMADRLGVSPETISRRLKELAQRGYITRQRRLDKSTLTWMETWNQNPRLIMVAIDELVRQAQARADRSQGTHVRNDMNDLSGMTGMTCQEWHEEEEQHEPEQHEKETGQPAGQGLSGDQGPESGPGSGDPTSDLDALLGRPPLSSQPRSGPATQGLDLTGATDLLDVIQRAAAHKASGKAARAAAVASPHQADLSPWAAGPLDEFCELVARSVDGLSASEAKNWPAELAKLAADRKKPATPDELAAAIRMVADPKGDFHFMTFVSPFGDGFKSAVNTMLDRHRRGVSADAITQGPQDQARDGDIGADQKASLAHAFRKGN